MKNSGKTSLIFTLFLFFIFMSDASYAQPPGSVDPTFAKTSAVPYGDSTRFSGYPADFLIQQDGKIIVVGGFNTYNGDPCQKIARMSPEGGIDTSFAANANFNGAIKKIIQQTDGKFIVCGTFSSCFGQPRMGIARLHSDGSLDSTFATTTTSGFGFNTPVFYSLTVDNNSRYLVGGTFGNYGGLNFGALMRFNIDGSPDTTFNYPNGFAQYVMVRSIAVQPDDKIIVSGPFGDYKGNHNATGMIRLLDNGIEDTSFHYGNGFYDDGPFKIYIQPDGKILCAGGFTKYQNTFLNGLVRIHPNGLIDSTFRPTGNGFTRIGSLRAVVYDLFQQPDGKLIAFGDFDHYGADSVVNIAVLDSTAKIDSSYNFRNTFIPNPISFDLVGDIRVICRPEANGNFLICGQFDNYDNYIRNGIARFKSSGAIDINTFNVLTGFNAGSASVVVRQPDNKLLCAGLFKSYDGYIANSIIRLNPNGSIDTSFHMGSGFWDHYDPNDLGAVWDLVLQPDNKIVVCGTFQKYNGQSHGSFLRLMPDGSVDSSFQTGMGFPSGVTATTVNKLELQSDGKILVGCPGEYNGVPVPGLIRLESNGLLDTTFNASTIVITHAFAIQPDGKIVSAWHGSTGILRLNTDGSVDSTFNPGVGLGGIYGIQKIKMVGNKILAGGSFMYFNNFPCSLLVLLFPDGSVDTSFTNNLQFKLRTPVNDYVFDMAVQPDGRIVTVGDFRYIDGTDTIFSIVRLNSDGSPDQAFINGAGVNFNAMPRTPRSVVLLPFDQIVMAGGFLSYNNYYGNGIMRLNCDNNVGIQKNLSSESISIYPNPLEDDLHIKLNSPKLDSFYVKVFSILGKIILEERLPPGQTDFTIKLDQDLLPGVYLVTIVSGEKMFSSKFVK